LFGILTGGILFSLPAARSLLPFIQILEGVTMKKRSTMFVALTGFLLGSTAVASAEGVIIPKYTGQKPSNLTPNTPKTVRWIVACQSAMTGLRLNCSYTLDTVGLRYPYEGKSILALQNNGGHTHHYSEHPMPLPFTFEGKTNYGEACLSALMPEVSGVIVREIELTAAPGYGCAYDCFTSKSHKYEEYLRIQVPGLQELPDPGTGDLYGKTRDGKDSHPEGYYATPKTLEQLMKIAEKYYNDKDTPGRIMSVNDMSLPWGGLFDYKGTFTTPHGFHRFGTDVDINRAPVGQGIIECQKDIALLEAVKRVAAGKDAPYLYGCGNDKLEPNGNKHIKFDLTVPKR
jgi:hypothetical protein